MLKRNKGAAPTASGRSCIWIAGSGSLAHAICSSLAVVVTKPTQVTIVARSSETLQALQYMANARAGVSGTPVSFRYQVAPLHSSEALAELMATEAPDLVVNVASYQSPWEHLSAPSAWTELIRQAGVAATLPLQAAIATQIAQAAAWATKQCRFVNAAYPDAVNPMLRSLGLPIFAGIGNVALLAATLQGRLGAKGQEQLQVLGHHWHLSAHNPGREARAWYRDKEISNVGALLHEQRTTPRHLLNPVTGHAAALLLRELIAESPIQTGAALLG